ncbi:GL15217 [Drosophila persimilis]|uniref:GL15217 n=1 Tax=Drosophila persimilis TaxID=7234 RepID=B4H3P7_DROPE|nr:GL15217 [Drosophila persimilis]
MNTPRKSQLPEHEPNTGAQQIADADNLKKHNPEQMCISILEAALKQTCQLKQRSADLLVDAKEICLKQMNSIKKLREENTRLKQTNIQLEGRQQQAFAQFEEHRVLSQLLTDKHSRGADQLARKQAELERMTERYNALQSDFKAMQLENDVKINELQGCLALGDHPEPENIPQQQFIKELEAKIAMFEHTFALMKKHADQIQAERDALEHSQKSENHLSQRHDNENLKQECDQLMVDNWNLEAKGDAAMQLQREAKTEAYRLSRHCEDLINELSKLREQYANLERSMQIVKTIAEQLAKKLKTEKDSHRKELQDLEEKIRREEGEKAPAANCSKCGEKLNDIRNAEIQIMELQRVSGSTELPSTSTGITQEHTEQIERRCGDQMVNSSSHMGKAEDEYQCLLRSYFGVRDELEQRLSEVDCLKKTIMEERAKTANILNAQKSELIKKLGNCCENERLVLELKHGIEKNFPSCTE